MWQVTIKLFFIRTNHEFTTKEEPNPTKKQLDVYMRKGSKYKTYLEDMYTYGEYGKMPTKIKYSDGGKITYQLSSTIENYMGKPVFSTKQSVIEDIMFNSLEDGMYGASPGSHGVYPTKKKYEHVSYNGKNKVTMKNLE